MNIISWIKTPEQELLKQINASYAISEHPSFSDAGQLFIVGDYFGSEKTVAQETRNQVVKVIQNYYYRNFDGDHLNRPYLLTKQSYRHSEPLFGEESL
ncbi:MAG: hypothetical protein GY805_06880 [Chloroflexi bacterium]|nr:hypothetical protein [Chloroflexota bacterium]